MKLIPPRLRPSVFLRRQALRRGLRSKSELVHLIAFVLVGRPAMVRRAATREGLLGTSRMWRMVAFGFMVSDAYRKLAVKEPDRLGTERLREGDSVTVLAMRRPTRRDRRAARAS